jgi:uncharacterized membrane protein
MLTLLAHTGGGYGDNGLFTPWEIHPVLIHFPIAFLIGGVLLDLWALRRPGFGWARTATGLLATGVVTGLITALAGLLAFFTLPDTHTEGAHGGMYWHLGLQAASLLLFAWVCWDRWGAEAPSVGVRALGWVAALLLIAGSAVGGWTVYHGGAGIEADLMRPHLHEHEQAPPERHEQPASPGHDHEEHHH